MNETEYTSLAETWLHTPPAFTENETARYPYCKHSITYLSLSGSLSNCFKSNSRYADLVSVCTGCSSLAIFSCPADYNPVKRIDSVHIHKASLHCVHNESVVGPPHKLNGHSFTRTIIYYNSNIHYILAKKLPYTIFMHYLVSLFLYCKSSIHSKHSARAGRSHVKPRVWERPLQPPSWWLVHTYICRKHIRLQLDSRTFQSQSVASNQPSRC